MVRFRKRRIRLLLEVDVTRVDRLADVSRRFSLIDEALHRGNSEAARAIAKDSVSMLSGWPTSATTSASGATEKDAG